MYKKKLLIFLYFHILSYGSKLLFPSTKSLFFAFCLTSFFCCKTRNTLTTATFQQLYNCVLCDNKHLRKKAVCREETLVSIAAPSNHFGFGRSPIYLFLIFSPPPEYGLDFFPFSLPLIHNFRGQLGG